jgi:16S rRNA processing protein RimM
VAGEVKIDALEPDAFEVGRSITIETSKKRVETAVVRARPHRHRLIVQLAGVDGVDAARALRGAHVLLDRSALGAIDSGAVRVADLIGFDVCDAQLGPLGTVRDVRRYPACDMLVVGEAERLIPMLRAYGFTVDRRRKTIEVSLPPGFEEL